MYMYIYIYMCVCVCVCVFLHVYVLYVHDLVGMLYYASCYMFYVYTLYQSILFQVHMTVPLHPYPTC